MEKGHAVSSWNKKMRTFVPSWVKKWYFGSKTNGALGCVGPSVRYSRPETKTENSRNGPYSQGPLARITHRWPWKRPELQYSTEYGPCACEFGRMYHSAPATQKYGFCGKQTLGSVWMAPTRPLGTSRTLQTPATHFPLTASSSQSSLTRPLCWGAGQSDTGHRYMAQDPSLPFGYVSCSRHATRTTKNAACRT